MFGVLSWVHRFVGAMSTPSSSSPSAPPVEVPSPTPVGGLQFELPTMCAPDLSYCNLARLSLISAISEAAAPAAQLVTVVMLAQTGGTSAVVIFGLRNVWQA